MPSYLGIFILWITKLLVIELAFKNVRINQAWWFFSR
jgi:hypothetical protein